MLKIRQRGSFKPYGAAVSAIEHALWDIAGKAANVPVYKLLGGKVRDQVRCYNGDRRRKRTGDRPEDYAADVKWMMEQPEGFFMVKQGISFHSNMKDIGRGLPLRRGAEEGRLSRRHGPGPDQRARHGPHARLRRGDEGGAGRQGQPRARLRAGLVPARRHPLRPCGREIQPHVARGHADRRLCALGQSAGLSRADAVDLDADPHRRADLPAPQLQGADRDAGGARHRSRSGRRRRHRRAQMGRRTRLHALDHDGAARHRQRPARASAR